MNVDDHAKLRTWFAAYEPAVVADVTATEVVVTSSRRHHVSARVQRSSDLVMDLNTALARLVLATS